MTHAERMLEKIEAELEQRELGVQSYAIANRSLAKVALDELYRLRKKYQAELKIEAIKQQIQKGQSPLAFETRFTL